MNEETKINYKAEVLKMHPSATVTRSGEYYQCGYSEREGSETEELAWKYFYESVNDGRRYSHSSAVVEMTKVVVGIGPSSWQETECHCGGQYFFGSPQECVDHAEALVAELEKRGYLK